MKNFWEQRSRGKRKRLRQRNRLAVFLTALAAAWLVVAGATADAVDSRLTSVAKLIEQSSAGRLFEEVELPQANERRERARELLAEARRLVDEGADVQSVGALLDEATREMLAAVRLVKLEISERSTIRKEYDSLASSLDVLLDAYVRISSEEGSDSHDLARLAKESVNKASAMMEEGDPAASLEVLRGAYAAVQTAISKLRGGETLVRSLHFNTPADEYAYEVDRNNSLNMLVKVLLMERMEDSESLTGQVNSQVRIARSLRLEGEALAASGYYEDAITTVEASTLELVKAIRRAGIYIPQ